MTSMSDDSLVKLKTATDSMINTLDQEYLRQMQRDMYLCSAKCCDESYTSMLDIQRCVESCGSTVTKAQVVIEEEMKNFSERMERCVLQCQDKARDKITNDTTEKEVQKIKNEFQSCTNVCAETHTKLIPNILKRLTDRLVTLNR